jgi:hypothetical protein
MMKPERDFPDAQPAYSQKESDKDEEDLAFEMDELIDRIRYKIQRTLEQKAEHAGRRGK